MIQEDKKFFAIRRFDGGRRGVVGLVVDAVLKRLQGLMKGGAIMMRMLPTGSCGDVRRWRMFL